MYKYLSNHDFLTLWRFEWISLRNSDFKFEKTFFKWRVRWTFQRPFKFINVGLIFAPKWLSRIGTLRKRKFFYLTFWKISMSLTILHTFSILLSSVFKRATLCIFEKFSYFSELFFRSCLTLILPDLSWNSYSSYRISVFVFRNFPQNSDLLIWYLSI